MFNLLQNTNVDFIGLRKYAYGLSIFVIVGTLTTVVARGGFRMGIEFTGGSTAEVKFEKPVALEEIRRTVDNAGFRGAEIQSLPGQNHVIVRAKEASSREFSEKIVESLTQAFPGNKVTLERADVVGPAVGRFLFRQAVLAITCSLLGITIYVGFRFRNLVWGTAGVLALLHDVIGAAGLMCLLNREMTLTVIAALLTIAGYSINDTIVVFDRMREKLRLRRKEPLDEIINKSINETLSRTIMTSMTVILALLALFFWGGEVIHDFSLAMLFGVFTGTYSSIGMAAPLVYEWYTRQTRQAGSSSLNAKNKKI